MDLAQPFKKKKKIDVGGFFDCLLAEHRWLCVLVIHIDLHGLNPASFIDLEAF